MNKFYSDILTIDECLQISSQMILYSTELKNEIESRDYIGNSEGFYNLPTALLVLPKLEKIIKHDYVENICFENCYSRIYRNGSFLKCHTDRPGLDITLSICVYCDSNIKWPLCISRKSKEEWDNNINNHDQYFTPVNSGIACFGTRYPHWRDLLICNTDEKMIQTFYHWKISNGP